MHEYEALLEQHRNVYPIESRDYDRIAHFYRQSRIHDPSGLGIGHGLFVLYAALPVFLTPDLLHKLRFNFKNFYYRNKPQTIHPVAVSDILMSSLCRQVKSNTYEIPESMRFFLLTLFQKCIRDKAVENWLTFPYEATDRHIAAFIRYYAAHTLESGSPYGLATIKALRLNADMYLSPAKALEQMAHDMAQAGNDASRQHRLAITIDQSLGQHQNFQEADQTAITVKKNSYGDQLQLLLTYSRTLKKFYLEGDTDEVRTSFEAMIRENVVSDTRIPLELLPVPQKIVKGIRKPVPGINPNVELALELIRIEQEQKTGYLELGKCGLRPDNPNLDSIWKELGKLTHLETLILSNHWVHSDGKAETSKNTGPDNGLNQIPACILQLTQLKKLIISGDVPNGWGIRSIENLHTLINLQYLDLSRNRIPQISVLKKLKLLEELFLSNNEIADIADILHLTNLRTLFLTKQQITNVEGLAQIQALQRIDLSHNPFKDARPLLPFLARNNHPLKWVLNPKSWETKNGEINLHGTGISRDHLELISKGSEAIWRYYYPQHFNPYFVGHPNNDLHKLYGNEEVVLRILDSIHLNNFLIEGERGIGKTSLLHHLNYQLEQLTDSDYIFFPVYLNLLATKEDEFWRYLCDKLFSIQGKAQPYEIENHDYFSFTNEVTIVLDELQNQTNKRDIKVILLMDEANLLSRYDMNTLGKLRRLFQEENRLGIIMAGTGIERQLNEITSPWYNQLVVLKLNAMKEENARRLILEPVRGVYSYAPDAVDLILNKSKYKRYQILSICFWAVEAMINRIQILGEQGKAANPMILIEDIGSGEKTSTERGGRVIRNPYNNGGVIRKDSSFYGRNELLTEFQIPESGAYYLKGNRRIGKSSLLRLIERTLMTNQKIFPIYLTIEGIGNEREIHRFFLEALQKACHHKKLPPYKAPEGFIEALSASVRYFNDQGMHYFLLIDEAENLMKLPDPILTKLHKQLLAPNIRLTTIMGATHHLSLMTNKSQGGLGFLENFQTRVIGCFSKEDAEALIRQTKNEDGEVKVSKEVIEQILQYAGTHPFLIQKLCHSLFQYGTLRQVNPEEDLVLDAQLSSFFDTDFDHLDAEHQRVLLQFRWSEGLSTEAIPVPFSINRIRTILIELEQLGFLRRENGVYWVGNYFLGMWIKERWISEPLPQLLKFAKQRRMNWKNFFLLTARYGAGVSEVEARQSFDNTLDEIFSEEFYFNNDAERMVNRLRQKMLFLSERLSNIWVNLLYLYYENYETLEDRKENASYYPIDNLKLRVQINQRIRTLFPDVWTTRKDVWTYERWMQGENEENFHQSYYSPSEMTFVEPKMPQKELDKIKKAKKDAAQAHINHHFDALKKELDIWIKDYKSPLDAFQSELKSLRNILAGEKDSGDLNSYLRYIISLFNLKAVKKENAGLKKSYEDWSVKNEDWLAQRVMPRHIGKIDQEFLEPYIFAIDKYRKHMEDSIRDYKKVEDASLDYSELEGLKQSAELLTKRINLIRNEKAIETDPSRLFKYDMDIERLEAQRAALMEKINVIQSKSDVEKKTDKQRTTIYEPTTKSASPDISTPTLSRYPIRIFLASSEELADERNKLRNFISEKNDRYQEMGTGIYLKLENWEAMSAAMAAKRKQDDYNQRILESDVFVCLVHTKVGKYTEEEFDLAWATFQQTGKPRILTYFKKDAIDPDTIQPTRSAFKNKLEKTLHHFPDYYTGYAELEGKIYKELETFLWESDKPLSPKENPAPVPPTISHSKNIVSGEITAGGNVHIGDMIVHQHAQAKEATSPAEQTARPDLNAMEAALNNADFASLLALLDNHFGSRPTTQYSTLRQHIEHALSQGLMPNPATVQGLKMLIGQLKKQG